MTHSPTQKPKTTQNWPKPLPQARHWLGWTDLWQIPRRQGPRPGLCLRTSRDDTGHFHQLQLQPRSHPELEGGPQLKGKKSIETSRQFGNQIFQVFRFSLILPKPKSANKHRHVLVGVGDQRFFLALCAGHSKKNTFTTWGCCRTFSQRGSTGNSSPAPTTPGAL